MHEYRKQAAKSRITDLDDKYMECDPLPDPENEKDLTTWIRLWVESKDRTLQEALDNCQTAENVIKAINNSLGEAMAQCDYEKIKWCQTYIDEIRRITLIKYDQISTDTLTYFEGYTKYTEEEKEKLKQEMAGRNQNLTIKNEVMLCESSPDMMFGIWANVTGKSVKFKPISFNDRFIA